MATSDNKRTDSIRVRLSAEMMDRFESLSNRYGMPPATLAAFAVARFVQQEENNLSMSKMAVLDVARKQSSHMEDLFNDENMERIFGPMFEAMMPQLLKVAAEQEAKTIDSEASKGDA